MTDLWERKIFHFRMVPLCFFYMDAIGMATIVKSGNWIIFGNQEYQLP